MEIAEMANYVEFINIDDYGYLSAILLANFLGLFGSIDLYELPSPKGLLKNFNSFEILQL